MDVVCAIFEKPPLSAYISWKAPPLHLILIPAYRRQKKRGHFSFPMDDNVFNNTLQARPSSIFILKEHTTEAEECTEYIIGPLSRKVRIHRTYLSCLIHELGKIKSSLWGNDSVSVVITSYHAACFGLTNYKKRPPYLYHIWFFRLI